MGQHFEGGTPVHLSSSGQVSKVPGTLLGFYVASTNVGTIALTDSASATGGTTLTGTITPAVGFHRIAAACSSGCYATIGGTALDVTLFFAAG